MEDIKLSFGLSGILPKVQQNPRSVEVIDENTVVVGAEDGSIQQFVRDASNNIFTTGLQSRPHTSSIYNFARRGNALYSCSSDKTICISETETLQTSSTLVGHTGAVGSVSLLPLTPEAQTMMTSNVCPDLHGLSNFVSGGWDGTLRVWSRGTVQQTLSSFQYSVQTVYCPASNQVIAGSGDFGISIFSYSLDNTTQNPVLRLVKALPKAHEHVIRKILPHPLGFISAGNDGFFKLWSPSGELIASSKVFHPTMKHSEFVHDVKYFKSPEEMDDGSSTVKTYLVASGDDCTVRFIELSVSREGTSLKGTFKSCDSFLFPNTVMSLSVLPVSSFAGLCEMKDEMKDDATAQNSAQNGNNGDDMSDLQDTDISSSLSPFNPHNTLVFCASATGVFVLTSMKASRTLLASEETTGEFESLSKALEEKNQGSQIDVSTLPGMEVLLKPGKENGKTTLVNMNGTAMVFSWDLSRYEWVLFGEALGRRDDGSGSGEGKKKSFGGAEYDHLVPVDIDPSLPPLQLPFNSDDDPIDVARAFITSNGLPIDYMGQIVSFITPMIDPVLREKRLKEEEALRKRTELVWVPIWGPKGHGYEKSTTCRLPVVVDAITKRVQEKSIPWGPSQAQALQQAVVCAEQAGRVDPPSLPPTSLKLIVDLLDKMDESSATFPVLDLVRVLLCNPLANSSLLNPKIMDTTFQVLTRSFYKAFTGPVQTLLALQKKPETPVPVTMKGELVGLSMALRCLANWVASRTPDTCEQRSFNNGMPVVEPVFIPFITTMITEASKSVAMVTSTAFQSTKSPIHESDIKFEALSKTILDDFLIFLHNVTLWFGRLNGMEGHELFQTVGVACLSVAAPYADVLSGAAVLRLLAVTLSCIVANSALRGFVIQNPVFMQTIKNVLSLCTLSGNQNLLDVADDARKILRIQ